MAGLAVRANERVSPLTLNRVGRAQKARPVAAGAPTPPPFEHPQARLRRKRDVQTYSLYRFRVPRVHSIDALDTTDRFGASYHPADLDGYGALHQNPAPSRLTEAV